MKIVFMGTPDFAAASLKKLLDEKFDIAAVFTQPDKPKGRGMELAFSPVKEIAVEHGIAHILKFLLPVAIDQRQLRLDAQLIQCPLHGKKGCLQNIDFINFFFIGHCN